MGDRAVEPLLGDGQALVEPLTDVLDVVPQNGEGLLQVDAVGDQVAIAVIAEDPSLAGAQAAQRDRQRERGAQREDREGGRDDRDQLGCRDLRCERHRPNASWWHAGRRRERDRGNARARASALSYCVNSTRKVWKLFVLTVSPGSGTTPAVMSSGTLMKSLGLAQVAGVITIEER